MSKPVEVKPKSWCASCGDITDTVDEHCLECTVLISRCVAKERDHLAKLAENNYSALLKVVETEYKQFVKRLNTEIGNLFPVEYGGVDESAADDISDELLAVLKAGIADVAAGRTVVLDPSRLTDDE